MSGCRGYISSRPWFNGERSPQHVQNIVLRDFARRKGLTYLLSAVEYTMPNCFQMLKVVLEELPQLDGILCYSLFMLPEEDAKRIAIYNQILTANKAIYFALEDITFSSTSDIVLVEDIWLVQKLINLQLNH